MATRSQLVARVLRLIDRDGDTNLTTRAREALDQAIRQWARKRPWYGLRRRIRMPATGTPHLILPPYVQRPISIFDVTNATPIMAGGNWDDQFPSAYALRDTGRGLEWRDLGTVPTVTNPSSPLTFQSSSTVETASVRIAGFAAVSAASGTPLDLVVEHESIALNGQTPVSTSTIFSEILSISKGEDTTGDITVKDSSTGTFLARIGRYDADAALLRLELLRAPAAGTVLEVEALTKPIPLDNDDQSPHPSISDDFLEWHAAGLLLTALGERQTGLLFQQKASAVLDEEDYRDQAFGDQFLRIQPTYDSYRSEEDMVE